MSKNHKLRQTTLFRSFIGISSPKTTSRSKMDVIESPSSDEFQVRETRLFPLSSTPATASTNTESHLQPLRTSSKRRRTVVTSDSSDEQEKMSAGKRFLSPPTDKSSYMDSHALSRRGRRLVHRREIEKHQLSSDEGENLADEVDEGRILESRLRSRNKKSIFQKNLEKLKRRKLKMDEESDSNQQEESDQHETIFKPFRGSKPSTSTEHNNLSNDEQSDSDRSSQFIIEDDDEVQLPPQFSMQTYGDLSYQFKKIFQFFVHVAVQSPGDRLAFMKQQMQDEYFAVPLHMIRRKVSGLRDSLVSSSVWRPEFKRVLEDYPDFELTALDFTVPFCDACHMGGRMSSLVGRVGGSLYTIDGFEPRVSKHEIKSKEFHLGRFCARRGRVFHQFSHWEHSLFQSIIRELGELRRNTSRHGFHRIAYPGGRHPPKDLQDADGLCDWFDERKLIEVEWHKMKEMMRSARHLEISAKNADMDD